MHSGGRAGKGHLVGCFNVNFEIAVILETWSALVTLQSRTWPGSHRSKSRSHCRSNGWNWFMSLQCGLVSCNCCFKGRSLVLAATPWLSNISWWFIAWCATWEAACWLSKGPWWAAAWWAATWWQQHAGGSSPCNGAHFQGSCTSYCVTCKKS